MTTIAEEINAVIRRIATGDTSHRVVVERRFATDAADLWQACTDPERLARWFEPVRGHLVLGGRYTLTGSGTEGDIVRCEPARRLAITWEYGGTISHVDVDLLPETPDRTVLRVTHHVPADDHWDTFGPGAAGVGWEESFRALALHLADDPRSEPAAMERFGTTETGRELTRALSEAWVAADHASGTPIDVARARAGRTATFYTATDTTTDTVTEEGHA